MNWFIYYQTSQTNPWLKAEGSEYAEIRKDVFNRSCLKYDEFDVMKRGDLVVDFDQKDFGASYEEMISYVRKHVKALDINPLIYLSSANGIHIVIPEAFFNPDGVHHELYHKLMGFMAHAFFGNKCDMDVYHKKHMIRELGAKANLKKKEKYSWYKGGYKVYIDMNKFMSLDPSMLQQISLTNTGDDESAFDYSQFSDKLEEFFLKNLKAVDNMEIDKAAETKISEGKINGIDIQQGYIPDCLRGMAEKAVISGITYHQFLLTVVPFILVSEKSVDEFIDRESDVFALNWKSATCGTYDLRVAELKRQVVDLAKRESTRTICSAMKRVMQCDCNNCLYSDSETITYHNPLTFNAKSIEKETISKSGVQVDLVADFGIKPDYMLKEESTDNIITQQVEDSFFVSTITSPRYEQQIAFKSSDFSSSTFFKKKLPVAFTFFGNSQDASNVKKYLADTVQDVRTGIKTRGLHFKDSRWVYVDENGCLEKNGEIHQEYQVITNIGAQSFFLDFEPLKRSLSKEDIYMLFGFNQELVVAKILAFLSACFLRKRFFDIKFPFLFIGGITSSGKSATVELMLRLFCIRSTELPSISNTTKSAFMTAVAGDNLLPVAYNEFKADLMKKHSTSGGLLSMEDVTSILRDAYDSGQQQRSEPTLTKIKRFVLVAPLIMLGENLPSEAAVVNRSIEVALPDQRRRQGIATKAYNYMRESFPLEEFGRLCLRESLDIEDETVDTWFNDNYRKDNRDVFEARLKDNLAKMLTGLDFLRHCLIKAGGDVELVNELIEHSKKAMLDEPISERRSKTDVEILFSHLFLLMDVEYTTNELDARLDKDSDYMHIPTDDGRTILGFNLTYCKRKLKVMFSSYVYKELNGIVSNLSMIVDIIFQDVAFVAKKKIDGKVFVLVDINKFIGRNIEGLELAYAAIGLSERYKLLEKGE